MRTIEQLFTIRSMHGTTSVWMPVIHGLSGEWLQTKLARMTAAGCVVRVK